jgi:hypothetical protein
MTLPVAVSEVSWTVAGGGRTSGYVGAVMIMIRRNASTI